MNTFQDWVTLIGAVIAAVTSAWNLLRSFGKDADKIKVGFGPLEPPLDPGEWMHVVSRTDHLVTLADYGFIGQSGALLSIRELETDEPEPRWLTRGNTVFKERGELFEAGAIILRDNQIGAYARTAGRDRYTLCFHRSVPWRRRIFIRLKISWKPSWQ